ncbi:unnamed protein product [Darwinula stevensoni]|uniref:Transmembrane protein 231 n=1 Tax=Darwinula stevensoni TaxID=69355 RepID=A0A7R8WZG4_9CRUS|nr:unnamed protein product [Darwinula stevensoni]CAG0880120.1 unnamed protein product [Darwinula stevensoni]
MAPFCVHSEHIQCNYLTPIFTKASLFWVLITSLKIFLPLLLASWSQDLWKRTSWYHEQPKIEFKNQFLLFLQAAKQEQILTFSSFTELQPLFEDGFRIPTLENSDTNADHHTHRMGRWRQNKEDILSVAIFDPLLFLYNVFSVDGLVEYNIILSDASNYTIGQHIVASVWVHKCPQTGNTMEEVSEEDHNRDGRKEEIHVNVTVPLKKSEVIHGVQLILFFDFRLEERVELAAECLAHIHHESRFPGTHLHIRGNLETRIQQPLMHKGHQDPPLSELLGIGSHSITLQDLLWEYAHQNDLSEDVKWRIKRAVDNGMPAKDVTEAFSVSRSTVYRVMEAIDDQETRRKGRAPPNLKQTKEFKTEVAAAVAENPRKSLRKLAKEFDVSDITLRRTTCDLGLKSYALPVRQLVTPGQQEAWLARLITEVDRTVKSWDMDSDVFTFTISVSLRYVEASFEYSPGFWETLKWAWVQYLALFIPVLMALNRVKSFVFTQNLFYTAMSKPWQKVL